MIQFQFLGRWKDVWKERQTLFYGTLLATAGYPKSVDHLKLSNMSSPMFICLL